ELGIVKAVEDVMTGVAFMAGKRDGAIDSQRKVGVDLDHALEISTVAAEGAPRLVVDVLDGGVLAGGEIEMGPRLLATCRHRGRKNGGDAIGGNREEGVEVAIAFCERAAAGEQFVDFRPDSIRRFDVSVVDSKAEICFRRLRESDLRAEQFVGAQLQRVNLASESAGSWSRIIRQRSSEFAGVMTNFGEGRRALAHGVCNGRRTEEVIDGIG